MKSSVSELKLQLGESLENEVEKLAARFGETPAQYLFFFLAKGRLTPAALNDLAHEDPAIFFAQ